jgi:endo-1,4-beta-xylanase
MGFRVLFGLGSVCCVVACSNSPPLVSDVPESPARPLLSYRCRDSDAFSTEPTGFGASALAPPLREFGTHVGAALSTQRFADTAYLDTAAFEFNLITPENELKWRDTEPLEGEFYLDAGDNVLKFARDHQMLVKGHTLVWHTELPGWLTSMTGADAVRSALKRHIETLITHYRDTYPGVVMAWDVVNEAIDVQNGQAGLRDTLFLRELGAGYIAEAFTLAHAADPDVRLFYNDYGIEGMNAKANAAFELVKGLVEAGVPIDGVGLQMHTGADDRGPSSAELRTNIQRYAELGLSVHISEMDVNLCALSNSTFAFEAERFRYNRIVGTCLEFPECEAVSVWGVGDRYTWLNSDDFCTDKRYRPAPLLFDEEFARKPAWWGVYDALNGCVYD